MCVCVCVFVFRVRSNLWIASMLFRAIDGPLWCECVVDPARSLVANLTISGSAEALLQGQRWRHSGCRCSGRRTRTGRRMRTGSGNGSGRSHSCRGSGSSSGSHSSSGRGTATVVAGIGGGRRRSSSNSAGNGSSSGSSLEGRNRTIVFIAESLSASYAIRITSVRWWS